MNKITTPYRLFAVLLACLTITIAAPIYECTACTSTPPTTAETTETISCCPQPNDDGYVVMLSPSYIFLQEETVAVSFELKSNYRIISCEFE